MTALHTEVVVAPPTLYLQYVRSKVNDGISVAGQNCYCKEKGAFTGEIRYISPWKPSVYTAEV